MQKRPSSSRLIIGPSETTADLLYATRFFVPDEMAWFTKGDKTFAILSPLEIDRAKRTAKIDHILSLSELEEETASLSHSKQKPSYLACIIFALKKQKIRSVTVPSYFPIGYAQAFTDSGIKIKIESDSFFPEREIKSASEIRWITQAQRHAEAGMNKAIEILKASQIDPHKYLNWQNQRLTSEILRGEIDATIIKRGGLPAHTIVACGRQACDPHEKGSGPLKANKTIIIDIFPRDQKTGYFGDLTRTFVKGKLEPKISELYHTVLKGQKLALDKMKAGINGAELHQEILSYFKNKGYPTEQRNGRWVGFFHGTGHSLGLEVHEPPRFAHGKFKTNQVLTVEPGLYYPHLGGVRIEDLVVVKSNGIKNLTEIPKFLHIK
ncbi:MAG: Xaa-Pro peptidase family protein [Verrucomicrobiota bacterium]